MLARQKTKQQGFTLVELLVALGLGLTLSGGIISVYVQNRLSFTQDEEIARLQENARFAINLLKRDLTMAGFVGGLPDYSDITADPIGTDCVATGNWALDLTGSPVELINNVNNAASSLTTINGTNLSCVPIGDLENGTDLVTIKRTADDFTLMDGSLNNGVTEDSNQIYLRFFDSRSDREWRFITAGNTLPGADKTAGSDVDYWEYYTRVYFIRQFSQVSGDNIPSLCASSLVGNAMAAQCIVEGIEDMQLEVGIDTDNDSVPDIFKATPTAAELDEAVVIRIFLLVRSVNPVFTYTNSKTYTLGTKAVPAKNDSFIRRVFSTTVQMRNAKLPNA